jgi:hypothetical protein
MSVVHGNCPQVKRYSELPAAVNRFFFGYHRRGVLCSDEDNDKYRKKAPPLLKKNARLEIRVSVLLVFVRNDGFQFFRVMDHAFC